MLASAGLVERLLSQVQGLTDTQSKLLASQQENHDHRFQDGSDAESANEESLIPGQHRKHRGAEHLVPEHQRPSSWFVTVEEAQQLRESLQQQDQGLEGGWQHMMSKESRGLYKYTAHRKTMPNGLTLYRTVTTCPDTSPLELMEFLLDDDARRRWEGFLISATILQQGHWEGSREQVVRWVRRFPFHFLSDREYVIARKAWAEGPSGQLVHPSKAKPYAAMYAVSRSLDEHPAAPLSSALVRTTGFSSNWRCAAVADPWGSDTPAAQVVLLHMEDIKIPEYLARTAVSLGMSKFVKELAEGLVGFKAARRMRGVPAHQPDPLAYGHDFARTASLQLGKHHHIHTHGRTDADTVSPAADYDWMQARTDSHAGKPQAMVEASARSSYDGAAISAEEALHTHPRRKHHHANKSAIERFLAPIGAVAAALTTPRKPTTDNTAVSTSGATTPMADNSSSLASTYTSRQTTPAETPTKPAAEAGPTLDSLAKAGLLGRDAGAMPSSDRGPSGLKKTLRAGAALAIYTVGVILVYDKVQKRRAIKQRRRVANGDDSASQF